MSVRIFTKENQLTESWSGGTTTQLAIYPEDSSYKQLNFLYRISTATIDIEQSVFTILPGVSRVILNLERTLVIEHKGKYGKVLHKFDTDYFQGDWETEGFGKARDFNLMTTGSVKGSLKGMLLKNAESFILEITGQNKIFGVYCFKGKLGIIGGTQDFDLYEGDFAMIDYEESISPIEVTAAEISEIVVVEILY